jgi:hypothetical protein
MKPIVSIILLLFQITAFSQWIDARGDCPIAYRICDANATYYFGNLGDGDIDDAHGQLFLPGLWQTNFNQFESFSAWIRFTPNYSGQFGLAIHCESYENMDFQIFENPDCSTIESGNFSTITRNLALTSTVGPDLGIGFNPIGVTDNNWYPWTTVQAGTEYYMLVSTRYILQTGTHRFWLSFQGQVVTQHPDLFDNPACQLATTTVVPDATNIKVYPNPFNEVVTLKTEDVITKIEVYSLLGKKVHEQAFTKKIDLSFLAKGVYAMQLYGADGEVYTKKLIKK